MLPAVERPPKRATFRAPTFGVGTRPDPGRKPSADDGG